MTADEARRKVDQMLVELSSRNIPDERREQSRGQLGFDYGFHQAIMEARARLIGLFIDEEIAEIAPRWPDAGSHYTSEVVLGSHHAIPETLPPHGD